MHEGIVELLIPITISLGVFMMIWGLRYLENKENMAMIEKGMNPAEHKRRRLFCPDRHLRRPRYAGGLPVRAEKSAGRYGGLILVGRVCGGRNLFRPPLPRKQLFQFAHNVRISGIGVGEIGHRAVERW